jgi:glycosyltransferase involved in cell wall biosynthesis
LADASIKAFTLGRLCFDLRSKLGQKSIWDTITKRDQWFQKQCLPGLKEALAEDNESVVFSYAYTAQALFQCAKEQDTTCILGQVDPGPAELDWLREVLPSKIANELEDRPAEYWSAWREEVSLADRIIVNSPWSKKLLVNRTEVTDTKISVLPLAYEKPQNVTPSRRYPEKFTEERPLKLLFLGQIIHRKGVHLLLEAMKKLRGLPVSLDLVGPSEMDLTSIPNNVRLHGSVDSKRAQQFYADADLFCLPTLSDGFALTQLEAAAHHLPLLVSRYCGQVVEDRKNGYLLNEVTAESIEAAILHCMENPQNLEKWSTHELNWNEYSIETLGERLTAMAEKVNQSNT